MDIARQIVHLLVGEYTAFPPWFVFSVIYNIVLIFLSIQQRTT